MRKMTMAFSALMTASAFLLTGCDDPDQVIVGPAGADGNQGTQGPAGAIPEGVWVDAANSVDFLQTQDGLVIQSRDTSTQSVSPGAFNNNDTGNRGFVGLDAYNGVGVSDIQTITVTARLDRGTSLVYLNLLVDCDGNGTFDPTDAVVVDDSFASSLNGNIQTITINATDPVFKSINANCGLPDSTGNIATSLSALPSTAQLINADTGAGPLPAFTQMASILFTLNDSTSMVEQQVTLQQMTVSRFSTSAVDTYLFH